MGRRGSPKAQSVLSPRPVPAGDVGKGATPWNHTRQTSVSARYDPNRLGELLRAWGRADRAGRLRLLRAFCADNRHRTAAEMERVYGNAVSLFLSRLSSWFRMSADAGVYVGLGTQLEALHVFLKSAAGTGFVAEFSESGGMRALLEVIAVDDRDSLSDQREHDVQLALSLLQCMLKSGRRLKHDVVSAGGVPAIVQCMVAQPSPRVGEVARDTLMELGRGNPTGVAVVLEGLAGALTRHDNVVSQRMACQALFKLLSSVPRILTPAGAAAYERAAPELGMGLGLYPALLDLPGGPASTPVATPAASSAGSSERLSADSGRGGDGACLLHQFLLRAALDMLTSHHLQVAHEAAELLKLLLERAIHLRAPIVAGLVDVLHDPEITVEVSTDHRKSAAAARAAAGAADGAEGKGAGLESGSAEEDAELEGAGREQVSILFANVFSSQYNAARVLLQALEAGSTPLSNLIVESGAALALMGAMANTRDHDTQCAAFDALKHLVNSHDEAAKQVEGILQPSVWLQFQTAKGPRGRQEVLVAISDPIMAADVRWRLSAAGWDCNKPRTLVPPLAPQIMWLRAPAPPRRPRGAREATTHGSDGTRLASTAATRGKAEGAAAGTARLSDKDGEPQAAARRRPARVRRARRTVQPHRRGTPRALQLLSSLGNTGSTHNLTTSSTNESDRDYKTKMIMLMRQSMPQMAAEALRFGAPLPSGPVSSLKGGRAAAKAAPAAYSAAVFQAKRPTSHLSRLRTRTNNKADYSDSAEVSFRQHLVGKQARAQQLAHVGATGQDDGAVLQFMRGQHTGRAARSTGAGSGNRRLRGGAVEVADAAGNLVTLSSASQARTVNRMPNAYPFNTGETTDGLEVPRSRRGGKEDLGTRLKLLALRSRRQATPTGKTRGGAGPTPAPPARGQPTFGRRAARPGPSPRATTAASGGTASAGGARGGYDGAGHSPRSMAVKIALRRSLTKQEQETARADAARSASRSSTAAGSRQGSKSSATRSARPVA